MDMEGRLKPVRALAMGILALALIVMGPAVGWWPVLVCGVAAIGFYFGDRQAQKSDRPEMWIAGAWVLSELLIASAIALTGGAESPALAWLAIPVVTLSSRFDLRGVVAGVMFVAGLMLFVTVGLSPSVASESPETVIGALALLCATGVLSTALMNSDIAHRTESVIDGLTGMLNRRALATRSAELAAQSRLTGEPIGLIIGDIDHFKQVNDRLGHVAGDAALIDVAYALRKELRAFDLAYRLGGEEFLVLLPGGTLKETEKVAERLRVAVANTQTGGGALTMSFGVASSNGGSFDFDTVLAEADRALYQAKRNGRDRVEVGAAMPSGLHAVA